MKGLTHFSKGLTRVPKNKNDIRLCKRYVVGHLDKCLYFSNIMTKSSDCHGNPIYSLRIRGRCPGNVYDKGHRFCRKGGKGGDVIVSG